LRREALIQRDAFGMPDLVPVVIDHSLSTLSDAKSDRRAEQAIPQCLRIWLGACGPKARLLLTQCHIPYMQIRNETKAMR
jgi:hypothetical protein